MSPMHESYTRAVVVVGGRYVDSESRFGGNWPWRNSVGLAVMWIETECEDCLVGCCARSLRLVAELCLIHEWSRMHMVSDWSDVRAVDRAKAVDDRRRL